MSEPAEPNDLGTKTVRISAEAAKKLQTIAALRDQMGLKFKSVEFLNGLVEGPITELYDETIDAFNDFQAKSKTKKKPKKEAE